MLKNDPRFLSIGVFILLLLCGFALYFIPLQNTSFCFDDKDAIERNEVLKKVDIPRIFNAFNTRFLVGLSFALNYQLSDVRSIGYRAGNLLIHCFNAFLVYLLIASTLSLYWRNQSVLLGHLKWCAFFASLSACD
jgi:hypothetical protein